jgi:hypothetical protein
LTAPGLELESLVVGGQAECCVSEAFSGTQTIRVRNYSLKSYNIGITSECQSPRLYYPNLLQASPEGKVWNDTLVVPFSLDRGGRSASESQELATLKDVNPAADQNVAIILTAAARGMSGNYALPEFMIQVDVTE